MEKWEYISIHVGATAMKMDHVISITSNKVNYDELVSSIPGSDRAKDSDGINGLKNKTLDLFEFLNAILDYLGNQGWEVVGSYSGLLHLKRKKMS